MRKKSSEEVIAAIEAGRPTLEHLISAADQMFASATVVQTIARYLWRGRQMGSAIPSGELPSQTQQAPQPEGRSISGQTRLARGIEAFYRDGVLTLEQRDYLAMAFLKMCREEGV